MQKRPSSLPRWATNPPFGYPGAVAPSSLDMDEGFNNGEAPPAGFHNWLFQALSQWINYFDEHTRGLMFDFAALGTSASGNLLAGAVLTGADGQQAALVVGLAGATQYTSMGDAFIDRDSGTDKYYDIACANDAGVTSKFMVVGTDSGGVNAVAKTSINRGTSWTTVSPGTSGTFLKVIHVTGQTWLAVDDSRRISRTTDDGATWAVVFSGASADIYGIRYSAVLDRVLAVGQHAGAGAIIKSDDHGATWSAVANPGAFPINDVDTDGVNWVVCGASGTRHPYWNPDSNLGNAWTLCTFGVQDHVVTVSWLRYDATGGWIGGDGGTSTLSSSLDGKFWTPRSALFDALGAVFLNGYWLLMKTASTQVFKGLTVGGG